MKVFHYPNFDLWKQIKNGSVKSRGKPGLGATICLGKVGFEAWETCGTFGLLEPVPDSWRNNTHFFYVWDFLKNHVSGNGEALLLAIEVDKGLPVQVADWGHKEGFLTENKIDIPERFRHASQRESERAYIESLVPLEEYLQRRAEKV